MADHEHLLSREQVAARLAVSVRTVRRYTDSGRLARVHVGRNVRYRPTDVERLIAEEVANRGHEGGQEWPATGQEQPETGHEGQLARSGQEGPAVATDAPNAAGEGQQGPGVARGPDDVSTRAIDVLRDELAALRAENVTLRREVTEKAEAAGLWQGRARTLEAQLLQLTAQVTPPPTVAVVAGQDATRGQSATGTAPAAHSPVQGLWRRLRRRLAGG